MALSGDGTVVASGGWDGTVRLWEPLSGRSLAVLEGHTGAVRNVALSADGRLVASSGWDRTVRLWEAPSGRALAVLEGHTAGVVWVALSGDGKLVASSGGEGTVRLWEALSGRPLAVLAGHTGGACRPQRRRAAVSQGAATGRSAYGMLEPCRVAHPAPRSPVRAPGHHGPDGRHGRAA